MPLPAAAWGEGSIRRAGGKYTESGITYRSRGSTRRCIPVTGSGA